jgi:gluconate kinase
VVYIHGDQMSLWKHRLKRRTFHFMLKLTLNHGKK